MKNAVRTIGILTCIPTLLPLVPTVKAGCDPQPPTCHRRPIDLVICLDTSGSMEAMIDSARGKLWDIVNELAKAKPTPSLRVGLLTYGSPKVSSQSSGWVVRQIDLTNDLDEVYRKMMALKTDGGDEYVGWVLNDALQTMSWTSDTAALKLVFVAGNESADQASEQFNFRRVCGEARLRGIVVNAIYGGDRQPGVQEKWNEVAQHGGGSYSAIDMQKGTVQIETPQDKFISELNKKLNDTYVPYGRQGPHKQARQLAQDENAKQMGPHSSTSRVAAKSSRLYVNTDWDLVDASNEKDFEIEKIQPSELPAQMQSMNNDERKAYVEGMRRARAGVQEEIQQAQTARDEFLKKQREADKSGKASLDDAILKALHEQAKEKGFTFEK